MAALIFAPVLLGWRGGTAGRAVVRRGYPTLWPHGWSTHACGGGGGTSCTTATNSVSSSSIW